MISSAVIFSALELGFIYALVALALFLSFRVLNIADMTTDGSFTLGCAVSATVALAGHPLLALPAAMLAGACAGSVTALLQTRLKIPSILAGIITNTGLYTVNLAVMGFSSNVNMMRTETMFSMLKPFLGDFYKLAEGIQTKYLDGLGDDVSFFCKKFDYRYKDEPWGTAKDAVERTIGFLNGRPI